MTPGRGTHARPRRRSWRRRRCAPCTSRASARGGGGPVAADPDEAALVQAAWSPAEAQEAGPATDPVVGGPAAAGSGYNNTGMFYEINCILMVCY